jgi:hypothetical protein
MTAKPGPGCGPENVLVAVPPNVTDYPACHKGHTILPYRSTGRPNVTKRCSSWVIMPMAR